MKLPLVSLLASAGFLTLVSCTSPTRNHTSNLPGLIAVPATQTPEPELEKNFQGDVPFNEADEASHTLLQSMQARFVEPPTDGTFGMGRVLMLSHNLNKLNPEVHQDGHKALESLEKDFVVNLLSFGLPKPDRSFGRVHVEQVITYTKETLKDKDGKPTQITRDRATKRRDRYASPSEEEQNRKELAEMAASLLASKNNYQAHRLTNDTKAVVELQKIYSTGDNCLKCHQDVQPGQPIGIIGVQRIPLETLKNR